MCEGGVLCECRRGRGVSCECEGGVLCECRRGGGSCVSIRDLCECEGGDCVSVEEGGSGGLV